MSPEVIFSMPESLQPRDDRDPAVATPEALARLRAIAAELEAHEEPRQEDLLVLEVVRHVLAEFETRA